MAFRPRSILYFFLLVGLCMTLVGQTQTTINGYQVIPLGDGAYLLPTGTTIDVGVQVRTRAGAPAPNVTVRFGAPISGATGTFDTTATNKSWTEVTTDSTGQAKMRFTAGATPGWFSVEAVVKGTGSGTSMAFTIGSTDATPRAAANEVRNAARAALLANAPDSEDVRLHGPYLLPAGTSVSPPYVPAGPPVRYPRVLSQSTWFAWVDDQPAALFAHPVRYVEFPASQAATAFSAQATTTNMLYYPAVTINSRSRVSLQGGLARNYSAGITQLPSYFRPTAAAAVPANALALGGALAATPDETCAIAVFGPDAPGAQEDMVAMAQSIAPGIAPANFFSLAQQTIFGLVPKPASRQDLIDLFDAVAKKGCKKVCFIYVGHGNPQFAGQGILLSRDGQSGQQFDLMGYDELAALFKKLGNVEICGFIDSCFGGQATQYINGLGLTGTLVTVASANTLAQAGLAANEFALAVAAANGDIAAGSRKVKETGSAAAKAGDPQIVDVAPTGTVGLSVPYIFLPAPGTGELGVFQRPPTADETVPLEETLQVDNTFIGSYAVPKISFPAGNSLQTDEAFGLSPGVTQVRGTIPSTPKTPAYAGFGAIQVSTFTVTPGSCAKAGSDRNCPFSLSRTIIAANVDQGRVLSLRSLDPTIATVPGTAIFAPKNNAASFTATLTGKSGTTRIEIVDLASGVTQYVTVTYGTLPDVFSTGAELNGMSMVSMTWNRLTFFHSCCYNPAALILQLIANASGALQMMGDGITFPTMATGTFDLKSGNFTVSGDMRVSTFNTNMVANGTINFAASAPLNLTLGGPYARMYDSAGTREAAYTGLTMQMKVGAQGNLPGGLVELVNGTGVVQSTCGYLLDRTTQSVSRDGGDFTLDVRTGATCAYSATKTGDFLTLANPVSGTGPARLSFNVAANTAATSRSGTITVNGQTLTITQAGVPAGAPTISGIFNGASFNRQLAASTWVTIFGTNLAPATQQWGAADFVGNQLPTRLADTTATIGGRPGYIYFISPTQINLLVPDGVPNGLVDVVVTRGANASNTLKAYMTNYSPALFTFDGRYVAAVNADGSLAGKVNLIPGAVTKPTPPGSIVLLYTTGLGGTNPATPAAQLVAAPAVTANGTVVRIGGLDAEVLFAGKISSGLYQLNVTVPTLPPGDYRVEIWVEGAKTQGSAFLTVGAP